MTMSRQYEDKSELTAKVVKSKYEAPKLDILSVSETETGTTNPSEAADIVGPVS